MGKRARPTGQAQSEKTPRKMADEYRALSHQLLHFASLGVPRVDFIREALRMIITFSGCDLIELWLQEGSAFYCCRADRPPDGQFTCEILDHFPGSKAASRRSSERASDLDQLAGMVFSGDLRPYPPFVTRFGACWSGDTRVPLRYQDTAGDPNPVREYRLDGDYLSVALIPLVAADRRVGVMQMKVMSQGYFTESEVMRYERVGRNLALALVHQGTQSALRERIKELTCLYGITQLSEDPSIPIGTLLERIAGLLPPAWQYPEMCSAAITLDGERYSTPDFEDVALKQTAPIIVGGQERGLVEVVYKELAPALDEGPFLKEERGLIDTVAKQLAMIIERRRAAEDSLRLQDQLRHADRLATIGQLAAGVAHELNEPLGSILGFAQLAHKTAGLPEAARADIEKIVSACLHARRIIQKLMTFARQKPPQKTWVNINGIVQEGLFFLERRCVRQGIEVSRMLDRELPEITADSSQIHQVLVNLVVNAVQAMPDGGKLTITTKRVDDYVSLTVEDTGSGMPDDVLKKLFTPFFTTKEVGQGVGLGLAVVHGIVTGHRGTIEVHSEVGRGSRFEVKLPATGPTVEKEVSENADLG